MRVGEMIAAVLVLLLAIYGCARLIQRICLRLVRCSDCVFCCRLAVPRQGAELMPLVRCLQSRAMWDDPADCGHTLMLLWDETKENQQEIDCMLREAPAVLPVTATQLLDMIRLLAQEK